MPPDEYPAHSCPVCEGHTWQPLHRKNGFRYFRCTSCRLEITWPLPTEAQIADYYKSQTEKASYAVRVNYPREDSVHRKIAEWVISLNGGKAPQTILDVGCLDGRLLDIFKEKGATTYGIEIQSDAAAIAGKKHDGRISNGTIEQFAEKNEGQRFDVVTAIGVIEHVPDPVSFLKTIRRLISSDGLLVLQTPNTSSSLHSIMGSHWPPYVPIEHIYLFSARNLAMLLDKCGFEMTECKNHWKWLQIEFFYLMTELFMPFAYKLLRPIVPRLPEAVKTMSVPLYSGEMLATANPVSGYKRTLDSKGKYWLYT